MLNIASNEINLIGVYLGFYKDAVYIETRNHYHKDGNYVEIDDYKKLETFDFNKSVLRWNNRLWKPLEVRTIFVHPKNSYRFEHVEDAIESDIIDISSESIDNLVIIYNSKYPESDDIKEIVADNIDYVMNDFIGDFDRFYAYYNKKDTE